MAKTLIMKNCIFLGNNTIHKITQINHLAYQNDIHSRQKKVWLIFTKQDGIILNTYLLFWTTISSNSSRNLFISQIYHLGIFGYFELLKTNFHKKLLLLKMRYKEKLNRFGKILELSFFRNNSELGKREYKN